MPKLRYDGKFNGFKTYKGDTRQWTIIEPWKDANGQDLVRHSFFLIGLRKLGIVKEAA